MKNALLIVAANLASVACVCAAGYLAAKEKDGWGWFLFMALCLAQTFKSSN